MRKKKLKEKAWNEAKGPGYTGYRLRQCVCVCPITNTNAFTITNIKLHTYTAARHEAAWA